MPSVTVRPSGNPVIGDLLVLADERAASTVVLAPARGALVTSFQVAARELLFMDPTTLGDASKNVRGGIPVLFPSPGKLDGDAYVRDGVRGSMKQHGFARTQAWTQSGSSDTPDAVSVRLALSSSAATLREYPWDFRADIDFALSGTTLRITARIENTGSTPMAFALGYHPYFAVHDKSRASIDTRATQAYDNITKATGPFHGFDLTLPEVDLHLVDHGSTESALHFGDGTRIDVRGSRSFRRWVVWTLRGKDFVCLEPWTAPGNALNTGEGLLTIAPGEAHEEWVEIAFAVPRSPAGCGPCARSRA